MQAFKINYFSQNSDSIKIKKTNKRHKIFNNSTALEVKEQEINSKKNEMKWNQSKTLQQVRDRITMLPSFQTPQYQNRSFKPLHHSQQYFINQKKILPFVQPTYFLKKTVQTENSYQKPKIYFNYPSSKVHFERQQNIRFGQQNCNKFNIQAKQYDISKQPPKNKFIQSFKNVVQQTIMQNNVCMQKKQKMQSPQKIKSKPQRSSLFTKYERKQMQAINTPCYSQSIPFQYFKMNNRDNLKRSLIEELRPSTPTARCQFNEISNENQAYNQQNDSNFNDYELKFERNNKLKRSRFCDKQQLPAEQTKFKVVEVSSINPNSKRPSNEFANHQFIQSIIKIQEKQEPRVIQKPINIEKTLLVPLIEHKKQIKKKKKVIFTNYLQQVKELISSYGISLLLIIVALMIIYIQILL